MRQRNTFVFAVFGFCLIFGVLANRAAENHSGDWTIRKVDDPAKVEFSLMIHEHNHTSDHSSEWVKSIFAGVDFSKPGRQDVQFTVARDAGKIECEGYLRDGEGAGVFHFQADPNYPKEMSSLGFRVDDDKQYEMAVMDVSLDFARQMKKENLEELDADKLIAFRIFNVTPEFIHQLRAEGLKAEDSEKLVAFRIHGVTPEMVGDLRKDGYSPDEGTLIAMRIHGATPEWISEMKKYGYDHVDLENLIAFRIHGVSPDFVEKLQKLGYRHPEPEQLIAMRIHGVTPDYIAAMRDRGMKDLTIDQLVNMRIHGID